VLIKQTTGTFWLFDASRFPHGTTVASDEVHPNDSVGLVLVQKKSMRTWLKKSSSIENMFDFIGPRKYYENLDHERKRKQEVTAETNKKR